MRKLILYFCLILFAGCFVSAATSDFTNPTSYSSISGSYQYTAPSNIYTSSEINTYWPILQQMQKGNCTAGTDFLVMIPPGGCSPAVVRSDLLEDQRVPIFCQLSAIRINPLIQVSSIKSIAFKGEKPKGVIDIQFHPARAAIRSYNTVLGSPVMNNIGYVVIVLEKNVNESSMMDWIYGNLTATMYYDIDKAYGTGQAEYYLPIIPDEEWEAKYNTYNFWSGKGFLRADEIQGDNARISLYLDKDNSYHTVNLKLGEQSNVLYFPFSYCKAGLQVKLNSITTEEDQALLNLDGNQIWVKKGSKILNDRCTISDLRILPDKTGTIDISCPQNKGISLSILPKGAVFNSNDIAVGSQISTSYSLAYSGILPSSISDDERGAFAVVVKQIGVEDVKKLSIQISEKIYNLINNKLNQNYDSSQFKKDIEDNFKSIGAQVLFTDKDSEIESKKFSGVVEQLVSKDYAQDNRNPGAGQVLEDYASQSNLVLKNLIEVYPSEKAQNSQTTFGEEALFDSIKTAKQIGDPVLVQSLGKQFLELYPNSIHAYEVKSIVSLSNLFDLSQSQNTIFVNNENHFISLDDLKPVDKMNKKARLVISGVTNEEVYEGQTVYFKQGDEKLNNDYVEIQKVSAGEVVILYHHKTLIPGATPSIAVTYSDTIDTKTLKENMAQDFFGRAISVQNINVRRVAYVSLNPHIDNLKSTADFTFRIGIEKRDIQLSDDKTKEMIKNLNASIKKWEEINTKLGNLIKVWKGACFATSIVLMAKSTIASFSGQGIARQKVMEAYKDECNSNLRYKGMTHSECYDKLSKDIDKDVELLTNSIKTQNDVIKQMQAGCQSTAGSLFSGAVVNEVCVKNAMREAIEKKIGSNTISVDTGNGKVDVPLTAIDSYDTLRELMAEQGVLGDSVAGKAINNNVNAELRSVAQIVLEKKAVDGAKTQLGLGDDIKMEDLDDQNRIGKVWGGDTLGRLPNKQKVLDAVCGSVNSAASATVPTAGTGTLPQRTDAFGKIIYSASPPELAPNCLSDETPVQFVQSGGNPYLLILQVSGGGGNGIAYKPIHVLSATGGNYRLLDDGATLTQAEQTVEMKTVEQIKKGYTFYSGGSCANSYSNAKVQYYDSGSFKGMPAIVPISLRDGWYVKISQTPGGLLSTEQKGYQQNGAVSFFYLCNVGADGLEKNGKWPDDICMSIDVNNYATYTEFAGCPSMKGAQFKKLIEDAQQAIRQAAAGYGSSGTRINILGQDVEKGPPVDGNNLVECQDFMSPSDCKILFNVCDPVICPASRCNLGGAYPVSNVIQSGIIGSIFLCLPNFKEGVMIPVCLSGIYAGIENFVSILKSERECLQTSLTTGQHVGICDEITSIYMCEFFWRQLSPVINILIPRMIEMAYGQGTRGGGEYLSVKNSWDTLQKNIDYFKNTYAQNAFRAFEIRNVEEAGGTFCKAFIGTSLPTSASALDNLLDPESPEQVSAWFSEISYSEATVPATSQYKVYFHIFAGNDQGVQYRVYLQDPPDSSYYKSSGVINVKNGYLAKGGTADESVDFTAPSGYKELCVEINAQQKCGFKAVSTSFAADYLSAKYTEQQAKAGDIKTEKECISGTPSILSLANPNIQSGVENVINPRANLRGIVRVCSTADPGNSVETTSTGGALATAASQSGTDKITTVDFSKRWQKVGYCDNINIGCWLDTDSVKEDVQQVQAIENSISNMEQRIKELDSQTNKETPEEAREKLSRINTELGNTEWIKKLKNSLPDSNSKDNINLEIEKIIKTDNDKLTSLGGTEGTRGISATASSPTDIANALMLRVRLYNLVIQALKEKYFPVPQVNTNENTAGVTKTDAMITPAIGITSIKFYDKNDEEITKQVCETGTNTLMQVYLEVKSSGCTKVTYNIYYSKTLAGDDFDGAAYGGSVGYSEKKEIIVTLKKYSGLKRFYVGASCIGADKKQIGVGEKSVIINYLTTNCPANVIGPTPGTPSA